jgi:hypothetical protein
MIRTPLFIAEGQLACYQPYLAGVDDHLEGMVGVYSPITGRRRSCTGVPVGERGTLIAVANAADLDPSQGLECVTAPGRVGIRLASGTIAANTPIPGKRGPADLVGCAPGNGTGRPALDEQARVLEDLTVSLEIHGPGCACEPPPLTATGSANQAGGDDA